jgi:hypothetical protein
MRRGVVVVAGCVLATALALTLPVAAGQIGQRDPNDTSGRLDVKGIQLDPDASPRWRFATFGRWSLAQIWDRGYLIVQLDTAGDEAIDHLAVVGSDGRRLMGTLFRVRRDGSQVVIGSIGASKTGSRAAVVSVALHKLSIGANRTSYFWSALTSYTGRACQRTCFDVVPDSGMVEQLLPGVTPTPSPTPPPTPSPTPSPSPSP